MITDVIADTLIQIKNAYMARHSKVTVPRSNLKSSFLAVLEKLGYVGKVSQENDRVLSIELRYVQGQPAMTEVKRISKPGLRRYAGVKDLEKMGRGGLGYVILSTPKGIKTHVEAKKEKLGGEVLFKIW